MHHIRSEGTGFSRTHAEAENRRHKVEKLQVEKYLNYQHCRPSGPLPDLPGSCVLLDFSLSQAGDFHNPANSPKVPVPVQAVHDPARLLAVAGAGPQEDQCPRPDYGTRWKAHRFRTADIEFFIPHVRRPTLLQFGQDEADSQKVRRSRPRAATKAIPATPPIRAVTRKMPNQSRKPTIAPMAAISLTSPAPMLRTK